MGQVTAAQTALIIESTSEAIATNQTEPTNYWWLLLIAIFPIWLGFWLKGKK